MSLDCALVCVDLMQFFRPIDMGLSSGIRSIEWAPGLFHVATARFLAGGWAGKRVGIVLERGHTVGLPTWEKLMFREDGWTNVLPAVISDLVETHDAFLDTLTNGTIPDLLLVLHEHVQGLRDSVTELRDYNLNTGEPIHVEGALTLEIDDGQATLDRLRSSLHGQTPRGSNAH